MMIRDESGLDEHSSQNGTAADHMFAEALGAGDADFAANMTLSVIIRFHKMERVSFLDEALFSLAIQHWHDLEMVVVIQNGTDEMTAAVIDLIERQPWPISPRYKVLSYPVPVGVDGRSSLLNQGVANASGRYLAFLDDDDVVYQHGYATLIQQLVTSGRAIAMGGCRTARNEFESGHWFVRIKESPFTYGRTRLDLFGFNFVPIHSYVIDRARTGAFPLWFDDSLSAIEDYDFLLRLCAAFEPDFSKLETPVCEYRFHGANSTPYDVAGTGLDVVSGPSLTKAYQAMAEVNERKQHYSCTLPVSEVGELATSLADLQTQLEYLRSQFEDTRLQLKHTQLQLEHTQYQLKLAQLQHSRLPHLAAQALTEFSDTHAWLTKPFSKLMKSLKIGKH